MLQNLNAPLDTKGVFAGKGKLNGQKADLFSFVMTLGLVPLGSLNTNS